MRGGAGHGVVEQSSLRQQLLAGLIGLQLVDVLHQDAFVLEDVSLGLPVETVVPGTENTLQPRLLRHGKPRQVAPVATADAHMCLSIFLDSL